MRSFENLDLGGKRVLLRADLNVPIKNGVIQDYNKIKRLKPTIDLLRKKGARIVLASHFGRPNGKKEKEFSLNFMPDELAKAYSCIVEFAPNIKDATKEIDKGEILLLENLRFYPGEEANNENFAKQLAQFADVYINDAFACCHRTHASIVAITKFLPSYAGLLLQEEVANLEALLSQERGTLTAIIGGKKVSSKFKVLRFIDKICNLLVICGAMANTMLAALGYNVQNSLYEPELLEEAREFLRSSKTKIILPVDVVVAGNQGKGIAVRPVRFVRAGESIFDVGPATCLQVMNLLEESSMLLWSGPFGMFEDIRFKAATDIIGRQAISLTAQGKLKSIVGGGDTLSAFEQSGLLEGFSYASTAGGAFLEWLESGSLPGLEALET